MSIFKFKQFSITQTVNTQKVGTDSMLLGAWVEGDFTRILDIGTGTGILALMCAQKNPTATVVGIEIDHLSAQEAHSNFKNSPFKDRMMAIHSSLQQFGSMSKFDLIISNPPYFENSYLSADLDRNRARHTNDLPVHELYEASESLLSESGTMAVVIPYSEEEQYFFRAAQTGLFPAQIMRTIREDGEHKRTLIQFTRKQEKPNETTLLVKNKNNEYSKEYITLTQPFYFKDL